MNKKIKIESAGVPLTRVDITPCAEHELVSEFRRGEPDSTAPDKVIFDMVVPIVCGTVTDFVTGDYMLRSEWFKTTKSHRVGTYILRHKETKQVLVAPQLVMTLDGTTALLESPMEHSLYEGYEVDRVIEETKVEIGVV